MQDEVFYSEMADAMNELSEVFVRVGYGPDEVRAIAELLVVTSGLNPVADNNDDASGS